MGLFDRTTTTTYKEMVDPSTSPIKPPSAGGPSGGGGGGKGMAPTPSDLNFDPKKPWRGGKNVPQVKRNISPDMLKKFVS